ncbi:MAG: glycosidase [Candidatus Eremiobacteraeota bacterium]|nr:glycosidase [Candidatus Eremiobacteraeota bacterium]
MLQPTYRKETAPEATLAVRVARLGVALQPDGEPNEVGGVLNPAATRGPNDELLIYPRCVAEGNISRVGIVRAARNGRSYSVERFGYALQPQAPYELRERGGYGCEDPRVTYVPVLEAYVMAYTAVGPNGPRIALALSKDAYRWQRLGLVNFTGTGNPAGDDKDAAFFPEPVLAPGGRRCLAFYHRPMLHLSSVDGRAAVPMLERMPFEDRESIRIAYVPLDPVLKKPKKLLEACESVQVLSPDARWGSIKVGAGTPPVRMRFGGSDAWMSLFHGVDIISDGPHKPFLRYSAGIVVHELERPDRILYRSPEPVLIPQTRRERRGVVDNVVFPTGIDPRIDLGERTYDVYYGMGDYAIGAARLSVENG